MSEADSCIRCGKTFDDDLPLPEFELCPNCRAKETIISVSFHDGATAHDHISVLGKENERHLFYSESERIDRRAAAARHDDESGLTFSAYGRSPQHEEMTLAACCLLVKKLNELGANWKEPILIEDGAIDCQAISRLDRSAVLKIQEQKAIVDQNLWKELNVHGSISKAGVSSASAAGLLRQAIERKAQDRKIPRKQRSDLILALNAMLLPMLTFDVVIEYFCRHYGEWARDLGFKAIWLIGPRADMVERLDLRTL
jgi:hypothetical protein